MPTDFRIATFNVENLFTRARVLNFDDNADGDGLIVLVEELRKELRKTTYDDKKRILSLYGKLKEYIEIVEVREKLFDRYKTKVVAGGSKDWGGFINFKREKFSELARKNTARVIREVDADIICLVEVENRPILKHFCIDRLPKTNAFAAYSYHMVIDGNDNRGIDVALASRFPITDMRSHVDDKDGKKDIFSRDCLEVKVETPAGPLWLLLNHFKSKGYGVQAESDAKRLTQATRVGQILNGYDLKKDFVVVCGDLNDTPGSAPLKPLMNKPNLYDALEVAFPNTPAERWTYHFKKNEQIDYLLISRPLRDALQRAGVERRGIYEVDKFTGGAIKPFDTVTHYTHSASDHGAVWADFSL